MGVPAGNGGIMNVPLAYTWREREKEKRKGEREREIE
jgi:hypothetical protein